jgi:hypothetical protein
LDLRGTKVSDAGLIHLKGLARLRELWLPDTTVSDAAVNELNEALPRTSIDR